jgi:membrane-bound lytic murein transglycosylase B
MFTRSLAVLTVILVLCCAHAEAQDADQSFDAFKAALWPDAKTQGITRATFDLAFKGVTPNPRVIAATKRQPEYGKPVGAYVNDIASRGRILRGQSKAKEWEKTFDAVEKKFGIERWVLIALWGIESDYGAEKDHWDVFRSLATLGYVRYRHPYFRNELLVAMRIMQDGHFARERMVSSWAGAMGQTQFMPSNVRDYAIDFSGDGRADIWTNVPDVLASTANYLGKEHWKRGLPWGFEVIVPKGFDYRLSRATFAQWENLGVHRADDKAFPREGNGILFFPSGAEGPAFIATDNYPVLKEYNNSDAYVIAVGHLADRINGGPPITTKWPADDRPISRDARIALQKKLSALGYKVNEFEGHIDFDLRDNIRAEQVKFGMLPDGNPTAAFLDRLGVTVR